MPAFPTSVHIPFDGTAMIVNKHNVQGRIVFTVNFEDGRPTVSITRKKDVAGYYWVPVLPSGCPQAEVIGRRIIEYMQVKR